MSATTADHSGVARPGHGRETPGRMLHRAPRRDVAATHRFVRRRRLLETSSAVLVPVALLVLWQLAATHGWIDDRVYPAPSTIAQEARRLFNSGRLGDDIRATLSLLVRGYALGCLTGFVVGAFMGVSRFARKAFEPLLNGLYTVPKLALLPLFLGMFGLGDGPKIAIVVVTVSSAPLPHVAKTAAKIPKAMSRLTDGPPAMTTTFFHDGIL